MTGAGGWLAVMEDSIAVRAFGTIVAVAAVASFITAARRTLVIDDERLTLEGSVIRVSIRWRDVARYRYEPYEQTTFWVGVAFWSRRCSQVIVEATDGRSIVVGDMYRDGQRALELVLARIPENAHRRLAAPILPTPRV